MLYFIIWCVNGFGGAYGDLCDNHPLGTCQEILYSTNVFAIKGFPNLEQIKYFCPSVRSYVNCVEEYKNECDFEEIGIFSSEQEFVKVQDFIREICDSDSTLHQKYAENEECLSLLNENLTDCSLSAGELYLKYEIFKMNRIPERDEHYSANNILCVTKSYSIICAALKALWNCGREAYDIAAELIHRSNLLQNFCNRMELHDLQTTFMDFLDIEDELRELLRTVIKP